MTTWAMHNAAAKAAALRHQPSACSPRKNAKPIQDWQRLGVRGADGGNLAASTIPVALVASDGVAGPAYLVSPNFGVIMKWNRSTYFATSVGLLADRIAGG